MSVSMSISGRTFLKSPGALSVGLSEAEIRDLLSLCWSVASIPDAAAIAKASVPA